MKSKNWQNSSWGQLHNHDHRPLLMRIVSSKGSLDIVYQLCSPWIHLIVEELHFGSQKTSALTLLPNEIARISKEYLEWLRESGLWIALREHWLDQKAGPWSMPLFLCTGYQSFLHEQYPDLSLKESSISYKKAIVEYSTKQNRVSPRIVGDMAEQIVESFTAWTNTLPQELKLPYQLHLEGLLDSEISEILDVSTKDVRNKINSSKEVLGLSKGRVG